jgi:hypothetical protein
VLFIIPISDALGGVSIVSSPERILHVRGSLGAYSRLFAASRSVHEAAIDDCVPASEATTRRPVHPTRVLRDFRTSKAVLSR